MGFLTGRVTFLRFHVDGRGPRLFGDDHLKRLDSMHAGRSKIASADGIDAGWSGGDHILDVEFTPLKNIINDVLHFEMRVDTVKLPSDLMRAYYAVELKALSADNPSGFPSAKQKREAREIARERLEQEAKDGRYKKRKCFPILWDLKSNEVLFGTTSLTHVDRMTSLFKSTFGQPLEAITAGPRAYRLAELHQRTRSVDDSSPSSFIPGVSPDELAWIPDESSRDFIGNEFLMWLWFNSEGESDTVKATDDSEITYMIARTLTLECPRGLTGHETITHEGPSRLPEAKRAIQSGKLPRKLGLTLVRHNEQYEITLHAETMAVSGAKLPNMPEDVTEPRAVLDTRIDQIRSLVETLDLLYDCFGQKRFSREWPDTLSRMQRWLSKEERRVAS